MGGHLGGSLHHRGETGDDPPEPLESVFSPPQQGCHGAYPSVAGSTSQPLMPFETNRGSPTYGALPPHGGPRWHPLYWGGGRFIANLLVNLLVSLVNVLVII